MVLSSGPAAASAWRTCGTGGTYQCARYDPCLNSQSSPPKVADPPLLSFFALVFLLGKTRSWALRPCEICIASTRPDRTPAGLSFCAWGTNYSIFSHWHPDVFGQTIRLCANIRTCPHLCPQVFLYPWKRASPFQLLIIQWKSHHNCTWRLESNSTSWCAATAFVDGTNFFESVDLEQTSGSLTPWQPSAWAAEVPQQPNNPGPANFFELGRVCHARENVLIGGRKSSRHSLCVALFY